MPDDVEVRLPSGETVTVRGVPAGISDEDFKTQFRQRHPEYFGQTATPQGVPSSPQPSAPAAPASPPSMDPSELAAQKAAQIQNQRQGDWLSGGQGVTRGTIGSTPEKSWWQKATDTLRQSMWGYGLRSEHSPYVGSPDDKTKILGSLENLATPGTRTYGALQTTGNIATVQNANLGGWLAAGGALMGPIAPTATKILARLVGAKFTFDMAKGLYRTSQEYRQAVDSGNEDAAKEIQGSMMVQVPLTLLAAYGTAKPPVPGAEDFKSDLRATAHDILNKSSNQAKGKLWDAHNAVSQRVGQLKNDIAAADYSAGDPSIPVADLWQKAQELADQYKASGKDTPKFSAASDAISKRGPYLSWKELDDLRQEVGSAWAKSAEGSRDAGATNALRDAITQKLAERAKEVDRPQQFEAYNKLWSTLRNYETEGVMGKLLNAKSGADFFDVLKDSANKADLSRTVNSLSKFGFPADYLETLAKQHAPLHDYVNIEGMGKMKLLKTHAAAAVPGALAGAAVGSITGHPFIGTGLGMAAAVEGAGKMRAASAIRKLGGAPSLAGEMEDAAAVTPVGSGERPTPPAAKPGAVNRDELIDALKSLGYRKTDATNLAMQAIAEHPTDFNAALRRAMQGPQKTTPAVKAEQIKNVKAVSGGSQAQINVPKSEPSGILKSGVTPSPIQRKSSPEEVFTKLKQLDEAIRQQRGEKPSAMDAKSIRSHNEAFDQAKREWMDNNPGKDPANHMSEIARRAEFLRKGK